MAEDKLVLVVKPIYYHFNVRFGMIIVLFVFSKVE